MKWHFTSGLPETRCGAGSTLSNTENVREWLPETFRICRVKSVLDVPCGDLNWMSQVDLSDLDLYIGMDIDPDHIASAKNKGFVKGPKFTEFVVEDIQEQYSILPEVDCILCRDFLQHLSNDNAAGTVARFMFSRATFLIATSHMNTFNDDIEQAGDFRPLNLSLAPIHLPMPLRSVEDNGRILGLWRTR